MLSGVGQNHAVYVNETTCEIFGEARRDRLDQLQGYAASGLFCGRTCVMTERYPPTCPNCCLDIRHLAIKRFCPSCGSGIPVNNKSPAIFSDRTIYRIYIEEFDPSDLGHIKTISNVTNENFLHSRKLAEHIPFKIFEGIAYHILGIVEKLGQSTIKYRIEPPFLWTREDTEGVIMSY